MTKITVTINSKSNARLFLDMLKSLKFITHVEQTDAYDEQLTKEEIQLLEERWEDYVKHPGEVQTWEEVKAELLKKHGA